MQRKLKILFVIESLTLAGSEKSLIALLNNLDKEIYDVDLQLFRFGGELDGFIPDFVNLLPPIPYTVYAEQSWGENLTDLLKGGDFNFFRSKFSYSINIRKGKYNNPEIAQIYWEKISSNIDESSIVYDIAIAYAQGVPTFYVQDKIKANKKITWVNANVQFTTRNIIFQQLYYNKYDCIVPVSGMNEIHFKSIFPEFEKKLYLVPDMIDYTSINKMSEEFDAGFQTDQFNILTVARLEKGMKGLDITIEACRILRDKGVEFHWYILGKGSFQTEILEFVKSNKLCGYLTLLGTAANPYPYFKAADLYVQTSRSESYGISIAEARLLNTPIVTTRFDSVYNQMVEGKNGLITDINPEAVADGIIRIMNNEELYNSIIEYLKLEPKENTETVKRFNTMVSNLLTTN